MSRLFGAAFCAFIVLAGSEAAPAAPAPLPKKAKEDPLVQRVRKALRASGYQLHEMRAASAGEWVLRFSPLSPPGQDEARPDTTITAGPISASRLASAETLDVVVQLAVLEQETSKLGG